MPVERVVECRQARTALGRTVTDLLDDVLLLALELQELALHLIAVGQRTFEFCRLVGDDLFVTYVTRLADGIKKGLGNSILV